MVADVQGLPPLYYERIDVVKVRTSASTVNEPLNRKILVAVAGFSVSHFHRIFTSFAGENISSYVRRIRMERAGRKLRMGAVDITEVALAAGYDTHSAFAKAFKHQYGFSPSEFRQSRLPHGHPNFKERMSEEPDGTELAKRRLGNEGAQGCLGQDGIPFTAFQVGDIQREYSRLKELGVEFSMEPTNMGVTTAAVFNDTCGNLIQIYQVADV
jgi:AraC-like DNA-binding protein